MKIQGGLKFSYIAVKITNMKYVKNHGIIIKIRTNIRLLK